MVVHLHDFRHLINRHVHSVGDLLSGGQTVERLFQPGGLFLDFVDDTDLVQGQSHDARLIGDSLQDGLADPPYSVGDEFEAARFVKTLRGFDKS